MSDRGMSEEALLSHIFRRSADLKERFAAVLVGPGDDCALVRTTAQTLIKVDQVIEGRHFVPGTPIDLIARKAMARPVSDVAAMAGVPRASLCAAVLPSGYAHGDALFDACDRWARHFGCPLVGGDIATGATLSLSVTIIGEPHPARGPVLRSEAKAGDLVWVTGTLGGSFEKATGLGRHLTFEPRVREAAWLATHLGEKLHAMMDVSDGLGMDGGRLAKASGVRLDLDARSLPTTDWKAALRDGEDYELLFTTHPGAAVPEEIEGTPVTRIGVVVPGTGCWVLGPLGEVVEASRMGWEHV